MNLQMGWRDLTPQQRAGVRAGVFFVVILVISVVWNLSSPETDGLLRPQDFGTIILATVVYVGLMFIVDRGLARRS
jgi:hypothetical protein